MQRELVLAGTTIHDRSECYVIAEIGSNHQGDVATAARLFEVAAECGAHAVKLQKRDNRNLYTSSFYNSPYEHENSFGRTYGEHRERLELAAGELVELDALARRLGITMFATAFDAASADFLFELGVPAFKVASADLTNTPLLRHIARFQKPMVVSTGGATLADVERAHDAIRPINPRLAFLQCTSSYPAELGDLDLEVISTLRRRFPELVIGWSSHSGEVAMAVAAYALGARIIEVHFTADRSQKGPDHAFSLEPDELRAMVSALRSARLALGGGVKEFKASERDAIRKMRKSLVAARGLEEGEVLGREDLLVRTSGGDGLPPYRLEEVLGRTLARGLEPDEDLTPDHLAD